MVYFIMKMDRLKYTINKKNLEKNGIFLEKDIEMMVQL